MRAPVLAVLIALPALGLAQGKPASGAAAGSKSTPTSTSASTSGTSGGSGSGSSSSSGSGKRRVIRLEAITVEGRIQKPQAFYILQRSQLNFDELNRTDSFLPKVVKSVDKDPF